MPDVENAEQVLTLEQEDELAQAGFGEATANPAESTDSTESTETKTDTEEDTGTDTKDDKTDTDETSKDDDKSDEQGKTDESKEDKKDETKTDDKDTKEDKTSTDTDEDSPALKLAQARQAEVEKAAPGSEADKETPGPKEKEKEEPAAESPELVELREKLAASEAKVQTLESEADPGLSLTSVIDAIEDADEKAEFQQFIVDYPIAGKLVEVMAKAAVARTKAAPGATGTPDTRFEKMEQRIQQFEEKEAAQEYVRNVRSGGVDKDGNKVAAHADVEAVVADKEFWPWVKEHKLMSLSTTGDWVDGATLVTAFKEDRARKEKGTKDEAKRKEREAKDDIHTQTNRQSTSPTSVAPRTGDSGDADEEAETGFQEAIKIKKQSAA